MNLIQYLQNHGSVINEGNVSNNTDQYKKLCELCKDKKNILEIGFNAGHSADLFLSNSNSSGVFLSG